MVKILSNGDIVPDNDARASRKQSPGGASQSDSRPRRGFVQNAPDQQPHYHMPQGLIFDTLNDRLRAAGVPRWHLGPYPVEPIVSLGFLLALLLIGFNGLILGLLLFFVCKWSGVGSEGGGTGQAGPGLQGWGGGGAIPRPGGGGGGATGGVGSSGSGVRGQQSPGGGWSGGGQRLGRS